MMLNTACMHGPWSWGWGSLPGECPNPGPRDRLFLAPWSRQAWIPSCKLAQLRQKGRSVPEIQALLDVGLYLPSSWKTQTFPVLGKCKRRGKMHQQLHFKRPEQSLALCLKGNALVPGEVWGYESRTSFPRKVGFFPAETRNKGPNPQGRWDFSLLSCMFLLDQLRQVLSTRWLLRFLFRGAQLSPCAVRGAWEPTKAALGRQAPRRRAPSMAMLSIPAPKCQ